MNVQVRIAIPSDKDLLMRMAEELALETKPGYYASNVRWRGQYLDEFKRIFWGLENRYTTFIAESQTPVGFITGYPFFADPFELDTKPSNSDFYVAQSFVRKPFRRRGIGYLLQEAIEEFAIKQGFSEMHGVVEKSNLASIKGLKKFGYIMDREEKDTSLLVFKKQII